MSSYLNERDVVELARQAQVCLSDDELGPMTAELNDLIGGLEPLLEFCGCLDAGAGADGGADCSGDVEISAGLNDADSNCTGEVDSL